MNRLSGLRVTLALVAGATALVVAAQTLRPISDETPPTTCRAGSFVTGLKCEGRYCDNLQVTCTPLTGAALGDSSWTPYFSEESAGRENCPANQFVAGLSCRGSYCDDVSLECVEVTNMRAVNCSSTTFVSEEQGTLQFGAGIIDKAGQQVAATGARCSGKYCDNMAFDVCEIVPR
jgi:hypothetical protein